MPRKHRICAYCGDTATTRDHIIPKNLYPRSLRRPSIRLKTVPACRQCNETYSDDEELFRNVVTVAGASTQTTKEIWTGPIRRSLMGPGGRRKFTDLYAQMVSVEVGGRERHVVFPANSAKVIRVVRKIVRGLCRLHGLDTWVTDDRVEAQGLQSRIPPYVFGEMMHCHAQPEVAEYWYSLAHDPTFHSYWILRFMSRAQYQAIVFVSSEARESLDIELAS